MAVISLCFVMLSFSVLLLLRGMFGFYCPSVYLYVSSFGYPRLFHKLEHDCLCYGFATFRFPKTLPLLLYMLFLLFPCLLFVLPLAKASPSLPGHLSVAPPDPLESLGRLKVCSRLAGSLKKESLVCNRSFINKVELNQSENTPI